jgi:uncharacterized membrane protein YcfT
LVRCRFSIKLIAAAGKKHKHFNTMVLKLSRTWEFFLVPQFYFVSGLFPLTVYGFLAQLLFQDKKKLFNR